MRLLFDNLGCIDRSLRAGAGFLLLTYAFLPPGHPWAWLALAPMLTGLLGTCPLYRLLGVSTAKEQR
jgi:hypothetical protein